VGVTVREKPMSWLILTARTAKRFISKINLVLALVCGALVFFYMFLVGANITGRYLFNNPIDGTLEIGQLVLASVIFFSLGYTQMEDAHIRVIAVLKCLPPKWQEKFEAAILALGFLIMILMAWRAFPFAIESFRMREVHMSVDVPIWPTKFIFFFGWSLLGLQFFLEFFNKVLPNPDSEKYQRLQEKK
jgi:TRAP-type C4-dicarboxylate transport system permease small subunit